MYIVQRYVGCQSCSTNTHFFQTLAYIGSYPIIVQQPTCFMMVVQNRGAGGGFMVLHFYSQCIEYLHTLDTTVKYKSHKTLVNM